MCNLPGIRYLEFMQTQTTILYEVCRFGREKKNIQKH